MARRPSKHLRAPRPLISARESSKRTTRDGVFITRRIPAHRAVKQYVCPGCNQTIQPGVAHVVAWPETPGLGYDSGLEVRRHWHSHCWERHA